MGDDPLPLYTDPDGMAGGLDRSGGAPSPAPTRSLRELVAPVVEAAAAAMEHHAELSRHRYGNWDGGFDEGAVGAQKLSFDVTRYLLDGSDACVAAFDRWISTTPRHLRVRHGSLWLRRPVPPKNGQLRAVPARLSLRMSLMRVPVELELLPWGEWRAVLNMRLARRFVRTMGWHRRKAYFASGNAIADRIQALLAADLARRVAIGAAAPQL